MNKGIIALVVVSFFAGIACGGTGDKAKSDINNAGSDLSNGVGTNGKSIENGVGVTKTDGGAPASDKK